MYYVTLKTTLRQSVNLSVKVTLLQNNATDPQEDKFRISIILSYVKSKKIKSTDGPRVISDTFTIYKKVKIVRRKLLNDNLVEMTDNAILYYRELDQSNIVGFPSTYLEYLKKLDVTTILNQVKDNKTSEDEEDQYLIP
jgi:hypothetical protein